MGYQDTLTTYNWRYEDECDCNGMNGRIYKNFHHADYEVRIFPHQELFRILREGTQICNDRPLSDLKRTLITNKLY